MGAAVQEAPDFMPGWLNLAELALEQGRWEDLERAAGRLQAEPALAVEAAVMRARGHLARKEFPVARTLLEKTIAEAPQAAWPRVILSHVLLQEGTDLAAAEQSLRDVLTLDPTHVASRNNLNPLLKMRGSSQQTSDVSETSEVCVGGPKVSLCMIVKNEEDNLPACLESVADLVNEIIVVDTGSTDRTKELAGRFGARIFDFTWVDSFAAARNESLRHARGEWLFWMDADDRLDEANRQKLRALFAGLNGDNAAYAMKCLCLPDPASKVTTQVDHVRLFRRHPAIRWDFRVHEQILPALRKVNAEVRWSDVVIRHVGYQDLPLRRRKLERDLRLLRLEDAERPNHPFTLFNLGCISQELGQTADAVQYFQRSLSQSQPGDSIVRKLFALLVQCHSQLGQPQEAMAACQAGRQHYPDDAELLFQEGIVRLKTGDKAGAELSFLRVLSTPDGPHFASVDTGVRGYKARDNLASLYKDQGRLAEAEAQWRSALGESPGFLPGWLGLGEMHLENGRWEALEKVAQDMEAADPDITPEAAVLRGRGLLGRKEFGPARRHLEEAIGRFPGYPRLPLILSHVLLQEGRDWIGAEKALRDVLALDPGQIESRQNLALLLERQGRAEDVSVLKEQTLAYLYQSACTTPSDIHEHLPTLHALAKECGHVTEMGTRTGVSTTALLLAHPKTMICYDRDKSPQIQQLQGLAGPTRFQFHQADVLQVEIEETDLLFIDTWHVYDQLKEELKRHAGKARKYIVLHDTSTFGERGETAGHRGLWPAVEEFLAEGSFRLKMRYENNNGLTVLERR